MSLYSSTASLRSSILRSMEENGRKYHGYKEGKYVLPVDEVSSPSFVLLRKTCCRLCALADLKQRELDRQSLRRPPAQLTSAQLTQKTVFQYDLCLLTFDNHLSFAPFTRLNRVLDVGCGVGELAAFALPRNYRWINKQSGYWALDFGKDLRLSSPQAALG